MGTPELSLSGIVPWGASGQSAKESWGTARPQSGCHPCKEALGKGRVWVAEHQDIKLVEAQKRACTLSERRTRWDEVEMKGKA
jgi:hypothetical protein